MNPAVTPLRPIPGGAVPAPTGADEPEVRLDEDAAGTGEGPERPVSEGRLGLTPPTRRGGSGRFVTDHLVELGYVEQKRVEQAIEEARQSGRTPEELLLSSGTVSSYQLARATAERFGLDYIDLTVFDVDSGAVSLIPIHVSKRYGAVPVAFGEDNSLVVAMVDPRNVQALDDILIMTGRDVRPAVAPADDIASVIARISKFDSAVADAIEAGEQEEELHEVTDIRESADNAPVIRLVNNVIAQAVEERASDVHFEPQGKDLRVRYRVDGMLHDTATIPRRMTAGVISRLKIMANLDIAERRFPQDGRISLTIDKHPVDVRVASLPAVHGEKIVLRLLDKEKALITLDALGMQPDTLERFQSSFTRPYGATLVTGPTGSGKTTSLYAALNVINTPEKNIITIEDPVEYQLPGLTQIQVNLKAGLTFAAGLRAIVRADPDVIMVGEVRDREAAQIAIESALTGHLVLTTLHTNDAPTAITRLTEMGIEPFLTASAIDCVISQRLARVLCEHCKEPIVIPAERLSGSALAAEDDIETFEARGCRRCNNSGYKGRVGLYEAMKLTDDIRKLAIERASADVIRSRAIEQGMRLLEQDGLEKVRLGVTSIEEVARVTGSSRTAD